MAGSRPDDGIPGRDRESAPIAPVGSIFPFRAQNANDGSLRAPRHRAMLTASLDSQRRRPLGGSRSYQPGESNPSGANRSIARPFAQGELPASFCGGSRPDPGPQNEWPRTPDLHPARMHARVDRMPQRRFGTDGSAGRPDEMQISHLITSTNQTFCTSRNSPIRLGCWWKSAFSIAPRSRILKESSIFASPLNSYECMMRAGSY